ncbi:MAG TPA: class I SAM-dependent methyltransferase [Methanoregulaceae archaeon]|nr:class I SAM-dependent methyltransferase [Methanoregulaceae archaeon]
MEHIRDAFNAFASEYDAQREYVIPELQDYYGAAVWAAESGHREPAILDIGAGTGLLSALMLQKFPEATFTLVDIAENMLDVARTRFKDRENIRYIVCDYSRSDLGGPYDIVCSALSIHHLVTEAKRQLFRRIFSSLNPGGMFVNADQADGETLYFRERNLEYWNDFLNRGPLNHAEHAEILRRRNTLDLNEKLSVQLGWLHEAGFSDVDVVYKNRTFIVTVARKT